MKGLGGLGLLVRQKKQFEYVTLGPELLMAMLHNFFLPFGGLKD